MLISSEPRLGCRQSRHVRACPIDRSVALRSATRDIVDRARIGGRDVKIAKVGAAEAQAQHFRDRQSDCAVQRAVRTEAPELAMPAERKPGESLGVDRE